MSAEGNEPTQTQETKEMNNATAETSAVASPSVFDEQEVDYITLDRVLGKLLGTMDQPWPGKEKFPPAKLNRDHVEFLIKETLLSKVEAEGLLTRTKGDFKAAVEFYLSAPLNRSFKI